MKIDITKELYDRMCVALADFENSGKETWDAISDMYCVLFDVVAQLQNGGYDNEET